MALYSVPTFPNTTPHCHKPESSPSFIDPDAAKEFDCGICLQIVTDPVDIGCINGHIYCNICIARLILERNSNNQFMCPSCRCICNSESIRKMPFIQRQIKRLKIKCPNCEITPQLTALFSHRMQNQNENKIKTKNKSKKKKKNKREKDRKKKKSRSCITVPSQSRSRSRSRSRERHSNSNFDGNLEEMDGKQDDDAYDSDCNLILCDWNGTVGDLPNHLLICKYEIILCEHCREACIRKELECHYLKCSSYPIPCGLCNELVRRSHLTLHLEFNCPKAETKCICGEKLLREAQPMHSERVCPEHLMRCDYHVYGCLCMIKRKDIENHMNGNMQMHLALVTRQCGHLTNYVNNLNSRIQQIEQHFNLSRH